MNQPSTLGANRSATVGSGDATSGDFMMSAAALPRRQASAPLPAQPRSAANFAASMPASLVVGCLVVQPPLSLIARWNSPAPPLAGDATCRQVSSEPADSPNSVTLPGSPPNCAMLSWTHCSASC